ncbi:flagellar hook-basal body complex protein FliE [Massilia endophytica]|uniref:flagellar hook-basal body complex protein FliE n=1 Tax=Massilia endophytica TaxID=2899220 RepID=UPI001E38B70A|nr:flagellar hook-basal body complex protein FliE [Massilia endophytica]UGQ47966.1 flagellar hook-basal body complex protein FliE [Massilia endophytica]
MNVEAILPAAPAWPAPPSAAAPAAPGAGFGTWFGEQLGALNARLNQADRVVQQYAAGEPLSVHELMLQLEEAKLSLQLVLAVRGKALDALNDMLRMPL